MIQNSISYPANGHSAYSESGLGGATSAPRRPLLANPNLFRNPNMVFESTYLCTATNKLLFPMAAGLHIPRSTETNEGKNKTSFAEVWTYGDCSIGLSETRAVIVNPCLTIPLEFIPVCHVSIAVVLSSLKSTVCSVLIEQLMSSGHVALECNYLH